MTIATIELRIMDLPEVQDTLATASTQLREAHAMLIEIKTAHESLEERYLALLADHDKTVTILNDDQRAELGIA